MELTVEALDYLHDADLHGVVFDSSTPKRSVSFTATFHPKCGLPDLDGRSIRVVADDVTLLRAVVHGNMANREEIDSCDQLVSEESQQFIDKWHKAGCPVNPRFSMRLTTHSGSFWEIMCEAVSVKFITDAELKTA